MYVYIQTKIYIHVYVQIYTYMYIYIYLSSSGSVTLMAAPNRLLVWLCGGGLWASTTSATGTPFRPPPFTFCC